MPNTLTTPETRSSYGATHINVVPAYSFSDELEKANNKLALLEKKLDKIIKYLELEEA